MHWSILCDFDGTISLEDVIDALLEKYGQPGWQELEDQWKAGKIGSRECMQGQVRLLKLDPATLDAHRTRCRSIRASSPSSPAPSSWACHCASSATARIMRSTASSPTMACRDCRWWPTTCAGAGTTGNWNRPTRPKAAAVAPANAPAPRRRANEAPRVLMIGDGSSDFCVSEDADFVFAKRRLITHCANAASGMPPSLPSTMQSRCCRACSMAACCSHAASTPARSPPHCPCCWPPPEHAPPPLSNVLHGTELHEHF